jgi:hypothetical protein
MQFYYKNKEGEEIPVDFSFFDEDQLKNNFVHIKVGSKDLVPTNEDLNAIKDAVAQYFDSHTATGAISGIVTHDQVQFELLDKTLLQDKVIIVRIGDVDRWRPTEAYLMHVQNQFMSALSDVGVKDIIVLDVMSEVEAKI